MKAQAKEEKQRRLIEKKKLAKEVELRKTAEKEKQQLEQQLMQLQNEMRSASEALVTRNICHIPTFKRTFTKSIVVSTKISVGPRKQRRSTPKKVD